MTSAADPSARVAEHADASSELEAAMRHREQGTHSMRPLADHPSTDRSRFRYTSEMLTREFADTDGVRWTVREIVPDPRSYASRVLLTRPGYEHGWLSFRSASMSCRIAPFPSNWRIISDYELERWCMRAREAARIRQQGARLEDAR